MSERGYMVYIKDKLSENWRFEVSRWQPFVDTIGKELLVNFGRCFVHTDRLASLISLANTIIEIDKASVFPPSPQFSRDLLTILSYGWGTMREFAIATPPLRGKIIKRWPSIRQSPGWQRLADFETRWDTDASKKSHRNLRNKIAFHVDEDIVAAGILDLGSPVVLVRGKGRKFNNLCADFATLAAFGGVFGADPEEFRTGLREALQNLIIDFSDPSQAVHSLFMEVVQQSGVQIIKSQETRTRGVSVEGSPADKIAEYKPTPTAVSTKADTAGAT